MSEYRMVRVSELADPAEPIRGSIDEGALLELVESIKAVGMIQPLIVVSLAADGSTAISPQDAGAADKTARDAGSHEGEGALAARRATISSALSLIRFEVVAGHRRLIAARHLELEFVPCIVYTDPEIAREAVMLHENLYREDLTAAEEGAFYAELIMRHDLTEDALCKMVRQKPSYIADRLDLCGGPVEVFEAVRDRRINFSVGKELNRCKDAAMRAMYLDAAISGGATAAIVRQWVSRQTQQAAADAETQPAQQTAAESATPVANNGGCILCGRTDTSFNLLFGAMCFYEWESVKQIIESQGIKVQDNWPHR